MSLSLSLSASLSLSLSICIYIYIYSSSFCCSSPSLYRVLSSMPSRFTSLFLAISVSFCLSLSLSRSLSLFCFVFCFSSSTFPCLRLLISLSLVHSLSFYLSRFLYLHIALFRFTLFALFNALPLSQKISRFLYRATLLNSGSIAICREWSSSSLRTTSTRPKTVRW